MINMMTVNVVMTIEYQTGHEVAHDVDKSVDDDVAVGV